VKIQSIEAIPVAYPTAGRFKFLEGPSIPNGRPAVLVKITADNGSIGWGESVPIPTWTYETIEAVISAITIYWAPQLVGESIYDLNTIHAKMTRQIKPGFSTGMPLARAGIDIALHDLIGKSLDITLPQFWGRAPNNSLDLSWTLNPTKLDQVGQLIENGREQGFQHFNVKVGPDLQFDRELCRLVRELAPDCFLWADANGGYDLTTALKAAPILADLGVDVLEAPIPPNQISGYQRLKQQGALPILMDEGLVSSTELFEFIRLDMLDGIAMKPARCGGLTTAKRQIELALDAGLMIVGSGLTDPDISLAATLALYGAYNIQYPCALNGPQFLTYSVLDQPFQPCHGQLALPPGPGLGIEVVDTLVESIQINLDGE